MLLGMATTQRLSPLDASFLYLEKPHQRMHVGCVALLEGPIPFEAFVGAMAERLGRIPRYRQRPVRPFLDLDWPHWEDDPRFDVRRHLRHVAVPTPGDDAALHELLDTLFATPLDPDRPLWETYLIDGLAGGRAALLCKIHHAMIDGVSGAQLLEAMADPAPRPERDGHPTRTPTNGGRPARSRLSPTAILEQARDAVQAFGTIAEFVREPGATLPFNAPISDERKIVWASFNLDDFLVARGAADCKVNDVVLAVVSGALRRMLTTRGVAPDGLCVRTLVPVSVRGAEDHMTLGNLVSAMVARLPIDVGDPRERLRRVAAEMRGLKDQGQARAMGFALQLAGSLPAPLHALFGRLTSASPLNTVTTNVPGPREACRMLGRRIDEVHPLVPLFDGMGVEFAIMSYADRLSICAVADPRLAPDAADIGTHLHGALDELKEALGIKAAAAAARPVFGPRVAELMSASVVTLVADDTLATAWSLMYRHRVRHLPVVATDGRLIGLVTHRDLLAAAPSSLAPSGERDRVALSASVRVADVMETHVSVASADEAAGLVGDRLVRHKIGCLPVVDEERRLTGIVTADDFVRWATAHMLPEEQLRRSA
jgi:WS/DGAT/MGAT family acyltransferase